MTAQEMIDYLQTLPPDAKLFTSLWTNLGEERYLVRLSNKENNLYQCPEGEKWGRISWADDCAADRIPMRLGLQKLSIKNRVNVPVCPAGITGAGDVLDNIGPQTLLDLVEAFDGYGLILTDDELLTERLDEIQNERK